MNDTTGRQSCGDLLQGRVLKTDAAASLQGRIMSRKLRMARLRARWCGSSRMRFPGSMHQCPPPRTLDPWPARRPLTSSVHETFHTEGQGERGRVEGPRRSRLTAVQRSKIVDYSPPRAGGLLYRPAAYAAHAHGARARRRGLPSDIEAHRRGPQSSAFTKRRTSCVQACGFAGPIGSQHPP